MSCKKCLRLKSELIDVNAELREVNGKYTKLLEQQYEKRLNANRYMSDYRKGKKASKKNCKIEWDEDDEESDEIESDEIAPYHHYITLRAVKRMYFIKKLIINSIILFICNPFLFITM
jgi:hypothetical protein